MKACNSLYHIVNDKQYPMSKDGQIMQDAFTQLVHDIIRANAKFTQEGYYLFADDLEEIDQKLMLSHIVPFEDYAWMVENPTRTKVAIQEYLKDMQYFIDQELSNVWDEDVEEMGLYLFSHKDGDLTLVRK